MTKLTKKTIREREVRKRRIIRVKKRIAKAKEKDKKRQERLQKRMLKWPEQSAKLAKIIAKQDRELFENTKEIISKVSIRPAIWPPIKRKYKKRNWLKKIILKLLK